MQTTPPEGTTVSDHFSKTTVTFKDGTVRQAGQIVRTFDGAFSDAVILGFTAPDKYGGVYVKLARPYVYATGIGTTSPSVLTGIETYTASADNVLRFPLVEGEGCRVMASQGASKDRPYADEVLDLRVGAN